MGAQLNKVITKREIKRVEIAEVLADHLLKVGFSESAIGTLGAAAGTSDRMLIYYFGTKEKLIEAVLEQTANRFGAILDELAKPGVASDTVLLEDLTEKMLSKKMRPMLSLWFEIIGLAIRGKQPYKSIAKRMMLGWENWIREKLKKAHKNRAKEVFAQLEGRIMIHLLTKP